MANTQPLLHTDQRWRSASALRAAQPEPKFTPLPLPLLTSWFAKGLARGVISEIWGRRSSGKTSTCLNIVAQATQRGEICAIVDTQNSFHPESAAAAHVELNRLIWVKCNGNSGHALRATDLFLHAGGFGVVWLDLCEVQLRALNQIPLSYWYRFRQAIENTPTTLLLCAPSPQATSSISESLELIPRECHWSGTEPSFLLRGIETLGVCRKTSRTNPHPLSFRLAV